MLENPDAQSSRPLPKWLSAAPVQYLLAGTLAAVVAFWCLGEARLDEHECLAALAGRGMTRPTEWLTPAPGQPPEAHRYLVSIGDKPLDTVQVEPTPLNRWLVPVNNGQPRLVKTPLAYWLIAAVGLAHGQVDEWAARLPSAVLAVAAVLVTLFLGRRMFGPAGLWGALVLASCVGFMKWGRNARPEMMLCLFITLAMTCFYMGLSAGTRARRAGWMIAFWLAMGLGNLAKQFVPVILAYPLLIFLCWDSQRERDEQSAASPAEDNSLRRGLATCMIMIGIALLAAIAVTITEQPAWWNLVHLEKTKGVLATSGLLLALPVLWYAIRTRPWRRIAGLLPTAIPGIIVMFAMFLPWMWYMQQIFGQAGAVFDEQVSQRAAGTGKWSFELPTPYILALLTFPLPHVLLVPGAFAMAWMNRFRRHARPLVYLFLWSVCLLVVLTLAAGKRDHYTLPMLPALCLLMGYGLHDMLWEHRWLPAKLGRTYAVGFGLAAVALVAGVAVLAAMNYRHMRPNWLHLVAVTGVAAVPLVIAAAFALRKKLLPAALLAPLGFAACYCVFNSNFGLWDPHEAAADFALDAAGQIAPAAPVANIGDPPAKTVFYFGRNIPSVYVLTDRKPDVQTGQERIELLLQDPAAVAVIRDPRQVAWLFSFNKYADHLMDPPLEFNLRLKKANGMASAENDIVYTLWQNPQAGKAEK